MRTWFVVALCFLCLGSSLAETWVTRHHRLRSIGEPDVEDVPTPRDEWIVQKLDHFDPTNPGTWWQRYQVNATFFANSRKSPVFLMIGGEGAISAKWMVEGMWIKYAEKYGALCFQLEHRFYGNSLPTQDASVGNLKYLSSEQALADLAYFIEAMNHKYELTAANKWVVFGGSYPGSLAAWARLKYPHLVHAAVSTSGPVVAVANFRGYDEVVRQSLAASSSECAENVHSAALAVEKMLRQPDASAILTKKFNLCSPLDLSNPHDVSTFAETLAGNFDGVVQYNKDNRAPAGTKVYTVDDLCKIMNDASISDVVDRYAAVNTLVNGKACVDVSYHDSVLSISGNAFSDARSWIYQTCTEFGFYQTSSSRNEIFGSLFKLQYFIDMCKDTFGDDFDVNRLNDGIYRTNAIYGGKNVVDVVSRVVFVQGSLDPWHLLGVYESNNADSPAILIKGTAHCANMYPAAPSDPPHLVEARNKIESLIGQWLTSS